MKFISDHREKFPLKRMCHLLEVSVQGWRKHDRGALQPSQRARENKDLSQRIKKIHRLSREAYGSPRITMALHREGTRCGHNRVARLMREAGIAGKQQKRYRVKTTQSDHDYAVAPNKAAKMQVDGRNQLWRADITYIATDEGWAYLAAILDEHTRKIVGWSMQPTLKSELVIDALKMAMRTQRPKKGLVHHSDRGVQYACREYRDLLARNGIQASMSRKGNCYDNATMESFFGTMKREQINQICYRSHQDARLEVFSYIEGFYNPYRIHTSLGGLSPQEVEDLDRFAQRPSPPTNCKGPFSAMAHGYPATVDDDNSLTFISNN
jgi:transposase InsO family protein